MSKMKVHIDFDNTLVLSTKRMVEMLNKRFNKNVDWRNVKKYNANDLFPHITQLDIDNVFGDKSFFNNKLKPIKNAVDVLSKLENYFEYYIVTLGTIENLCNKEKWCRDNLCFNYKFIGLNDFNIKKSCIDMSGGVMIDDNIDILMSTNAKYKILITNGQDVDWNQTHPILHKDIILTNDWKDIEIFLEKKVA